MSPPRKSMRVSAICGHMRHAPPGEKRFGRSRTRSSRRAGRPLLTTKMPKSDVPAATRFCTSARRPHMKSGENRHPIPGTIPKISIYPGRSARFVEFDKQMMTAPILRFQVSRGLRYSRFLDRASRFLFGPFVVWDGHTCGIANMSLDAELVDISRCPSSHRAFWPRPNSKLS